MYASFYGFHENPFSLLPDPDFLYLSPQHEHALNLLQLAIINRSGFCAISGAPGTGKTTLIRALLARLDDTICTGLITDTYAGFSELLERILFAFELDCPEKDDVSRYKQFTDFVIRQYAANRNVLLIVDEAQNLSPGAMEQLRMLSNINADKHAMIQIMLIGQESLQDKLRSPYLKQLAQRIEVNHQLAPLDASDTCTYIQHRISKAGGPAGLFDDKACKYIHWKSDGIPRVINRICDLALVYGYAADKHEISAEMVAAASGKQLSGEPTTKATAHDTLANASSRNAGVRGKSTSRNSKRPTVVKTVPVPVLTEAPVSDSNIPLNDKNDAPDEIDELTTKREAVARASEQKAAAMVLLKEKSEAAQYAVEQAESLAAAAQRASAKNASTTEELEKRAECCERANRQLEAERARVEQLTAEANTAKQAAVALEESASEALRRANEEESILAQQLEATQLAEQQAIAAAVAATEAAQQALRERIAAEKVAAEISEKAEAAVNQAREELIKTESRIIEQLTELNIAAEQTDTDQQLASEAANQKSDELETARAAAESTAQQVQKLANERDEITTSAEQQARITREMNEKAEQAAIEARRAKEVLHNTEQTTAALVTAEKLHAAELADSLAQRARQEADRAVASEAAALRKAQEKEELARAAAEQAAKAKVDAEKAAVAEMRMLMEEDATPQHDDHKENTDTLYTPANSPIPQEELAAATRLAAQARTHQKRKSRWSLFAASAAGIVLISWMSIETEYPATLDHAAVSAQSETAALEISPASKQKDTNPPKPIE